MVVHLFYFCTHAHATTPGTVVVFRYLDGSTRLEIRVKLEIFAVEVTDSGITNLVEIVGKNLGRETYRDTFHTLCQQQRKLYRQVYRFLVSAVVRKLPLCGLGVEHHLLGQGCQSGFDISGSSRTVAREDVAPVSLCVDQHLLLSQLHQGITDGSIAVGVELHGLAHDAGHFIIPAVFHTPHGVQDTALNRLQTINDMGNGTLQDGVGGIV